MGRRTGRLAGAVGAGSGPARVRVELDEGELELVRKLVRHHFGNPHDEPRMKVSDLETLEGLLVKVQRAFLELA